MEEKVLKKLREGWDRLLRDGQGLNFSKGQILFYKGHIPCGLFVLLSGEVKFDPFGGSEKESKQRRCQEDHFWSSPKGRVIGLTPYFDDAPYCCTCTAGEDCTVIFVSKSQLLQLESGREGGRISA